VFVVAEIGISFVLVIGAALMASSFWNLIRIDVGFDPKHASASSFYLNGTEYAERIAARIGSESNQR
jgi:hypothetical protein